MEPEDTPDTREGGQAPPSAPHIVPDMALWVPARPRAAGTGGCRGHWAASPSPLEVSDVARDGHRDADQAGRAQAPPRTHGTNGPGGTGHPRCADTVPESSAGPADEVGTAPVRPTLGGGAGAGLLPACPGAEPPLPPCPGALAPGPRHGAQGCPAHRGRRPRRCRVSASRCWLWGLGEEAGALARLGALQPRSLSSGWGTSAGGAPGDRVGGTQGQPGRPVPDTAESGPARVRPSVRPPASPLPWPCTPLPRSHPGPAPLWCPVHRAEGIEGGAQAPSPAGGAAGGAAGPAGLTPGGRPRGQHRGRAPRTRAVAAAPETRPAAEAPGAPAADGRAPVGGRRRPALHAPGARPAHARYCPGRQEPAVGTGRPADWCSRSRRASAGGGGGGGARPCRLLGTRWAFWDVSRHPGLRWVAFLGVRRACRCRDPRALVRGGGAVSGGRAEGPSVPACPLVPASGAQRGGSWVWGSSGPPAWHQLQGAQAPGREVLTGATWLHALVPQPTASRPSCGTPAWPARRCSPSSFR